MNRWKIAARSCVRLDMIANSYTRQELTRLHRAEVAAQARHADLIRQARAGQLQPELQEGRRYERRNRLAVLLRGRPAAV